MEQCQERVNGSGVGQHTYVAVVSFVAGDDSRTAGAAVGSVFVVRVGSREAREGEPKEVEGDEGGTSSHCPTSSLSVKRSVDAFVLCWAIVEVVIDN